MAFNFNFAPQPQATKPTFSFTPAPSTTQPTQSTNTIFGTSNQAPNQSTLGPVAPSTSTSQAQIDLNHLRPTTKYDQLTPDLQREIEGLDTAILNQIKLASEVADLLPAVVSVGETLPGSVELVARKIEEVETGLENDAESIVAIRDGSAKKAEGEAKCVFRAVDRLKVPRQYQVGVGQNESIIGTGMGGGASIYGGSGLSGWWNNPQVMRGSVRGGGVSGAQGQTMQLPGEETDDNMGPKTLTELINTRTDEITHTMRGNRDMLQEIEDFVGGLESKIRGKERELNERLNYGAQNGGDIPSEKDHQMQLLRYVFGEVDRSMYEVAGKVGSVRDDVQELGFELGRRR